MRSGGAYDVWFGILRIYTGVFWMSHALQKIIDPNFGSPDGNIARLVSTAVSSGSGTYQAFLVETVEPHLVLFATIFTYAELLIACSLILGFATRLGAIGGFCIAGLYWFMSGQMASIGGYSSDNAAAAILSLSCLVLPVGTFMGLDGLRGRSRRSLRGRPQESESDPVTGPETVMPSNPDAPPEGRPVRPPG